MDQIIRKHNLAERKVINNAKVGRQTDFTEPNDPTDLSMIPESAWQGRTITGKFLYQLCTNPRGSINSRGIRIRGARIVGEVNFEGATVRHILALEQCLIETDTIVMSDAHFRRLDLSYSVCGEVRAENLHTDGHLVLRGTTIRGPILLTNSAIKGELICSEAHLLNPDADAFTASRTEVTGSVILENVTALGAIHLDGTTIGGHLRCKDCKLTNANGETLDARYSRISGSVDLQGASIHGRVSLTNADIGGVLNCDNSSLARCDPNSADPPDRFADVA